MENVADILFDYLRDVIYDPISASLDVETLPDSFQELGKGLQFFGHCVIEARKLAQALSKGDLNSDVPPSYNEIAAPLKTLHAALWHLTWQAQQIAKGDYQQHVDFMGDFSKAFNMMALQLEERKNLENQERSKLQRYINLILTNTPNIVLSFDTTGKAVFASESFLKRNRALSVEELQSKTFSELFSPISPDGFLQNMESLFLSARNFKSTTMVEQELDIGRDGNARTYLIQITPTFIDNETFMGIMVIFDDITEIVRARKEAEHSARAKSDFLARMSHEMHTPMNAIIGMASIGKSSPEIEKKDYSFTVIEDASAHLLDVINDVLDMSKIEEGKLEMTPGEFSFNGMLKSIVDATTALVSDKEQIFTVDIDAGIPDSIILDELRLTQVINNLLSNAVKFTPENGSIALTARKIGESDGYCKIRFIVSDTGIGISEEQQEQLFLPFVQIDGGNSRKFGGTGLGLAISKYIVDRMGGSIWVESEYGNGSSFIFDVMAQTGAETGHVSDAGDNDGDIGGIFAGQRILIAEDVDINREIISTLLDETGAEISFAVNGEEVVEMVLADPAKYNLVLMDVQMPIMDGYEATMRIRSSGIPGADTIPIIAMTANVFLEDVQRCLSAGMNSHLGKPVNIDEVIIKLREYL